MGQREWPKRPLDLISIDYLVELPITARRNIHLLVSNDHFSKFSRKFRVPTDMRFGTFSQGKKFPLSIEQFSEQLSSMYELARQIIRTRLRDFRACLLSNIPTPPIVLSHEFFYADAESSVQPLLTSWYLSSRSSWKSLYVGMYKISTL